MVDIAANYQRVMETIRRTAERCGRDPTEIKLLAASKSQGIAEVRAAVRAGVRLFGENYVQEAKIKKEAIEGSVEWHMIGHLQRNKVKVALDLFSVIQSLDSLELAEALNKEGQKRGQAVRAFVEVNLGNELTKSGLPRERLVPFLKAVGELSHLSVEGLMGIPPFREDPEEVRPDFHALRDLRAELAMLRIPHVDLGELSMGMTHDYPIAIEEGATIVRVGTAIFGERKG